MKVKLIMSAVLILITQQLHAQTGKVGINITAPQVSMHINDGLAVNSITYHTTVAIFNIPVGNRTYIRIRSDGTSATRQITLSNGLHPGQLLIIHCTGTGIRLEDSDGNLELQIAAPTANLGTDDTLTLICDGTEWVELHRSDN